MISKDFVDGMLEVADEIWVAVWSSVDVDDGVDWVVFVFVCVYLDYDCCCVWGFDVFDCVVEVVFYVCCDVCFVVWCVCLDFEVVLVGWVCEVVVCECDDVGCIFVVL